MKNWLDTFPGIMTMIVVTLLVSEAVFSIFFERAIVQFFAPSETVLELLHVVLETIIMAPILYLLIFRRIQKNANGLLESNKQIELYLKFFTLSLDPMGIADPFGNFIRVNPSFLKLLGYTEGEIISKPFLEFISPEDRDSTSEEMKRQMKIGSSLNFENHYLRKDGTKVLLSWTAFFDKKSGATYATARDITKIREIEKTLVEKETHLKTLIQTIPDLIWLKNAEGVYLSCNPAFENFFGAKEGDIVGKTDYDFVSKELADSFRENDERALSAKGTTKNEEWITFASDGHRALVETIKTPLLDNSGKVIGVLGIARDITERKLAQEEISKSEHGLMEAQRIAHLGSWRLDLLKNELSWSEENYRIFGFENTKINATYEVFLETVHPDDRDFVNKAYTESVKTRVPYNIDHRLLLKDGTVKYVNERCETVYDEAGKPLYSIGTTYDITESKIAEQKIKRLSSLYEALSKSNKAIVYSKNKEELFIQICRAAVESSGFKMAWVGLVDESRKQIVPVASYGDTRGYLDNIKVTTDANDPLGQGPTGTAVREGAPFWCQDFLNDPYTAPWRDVGIRSGWASSAALPLYQKGEAIGALTLYGAETNAFDESAKNLLTEMAADISYALDIFVDQTEKRETEADLREAEVQDEAILSSLGEGMVATDNDGKIIKMNQMAEKLLGWKESEVIGRKATEVIPAIDENGAAVPEEKRICALVADKNNMKTMSGTITLIKKNGSQIPVSETATPVIIDRENTGAVIIFRDITKEREIEKTRGDLLALASHQLRTPLSGTKWLIETLRRGIHGTLTPHQEEYLTEIYKINERMTTLVSDMLGILRIEGTSIKANIQEVPASTILDPIFETFDSVARGKKIKLVLEGDGNQTVKTDPLLLRNIIESFVSNAINYSNPDSEVYLSVNREEAGVVIAVKDSGIGIPKDEQARLFERFYRAINARTFNTKGTGLGLYIASTLAKKIDATLSFESEEGKGSTFSVHIPYPQKGVLPENSTNV